MSGNRALLAFLPWNLDAHLVTWHTAVVVLLVYIARKQQQLLRAARYDATTPWWYEMADAVNRIRPGTF